MFMHGCHDAIITKVEKLHRFLGSQLWAVTRGDRQDFGIKRREDRPDYRYGSNQVAAVDQDQPGAGNSQRLRNSGPAWGQNQDGKRSWSDQRKPLTYEAMLDGPCSYHTHDPRGPANHSSRQCSWYQRTLKEGGGSGGNQMGAPQRPTTIPLTGAHCSRECASTKACSSETYG